MINYFDNLLLCIKNHHIRYANKGGAVCIECVECHNILVVLGDIQ
jgi:hypothetical protein